MVTGAADNGQMILLSGLVACLFLLGLAVLLADVRETGTVMGGQSLSPVALENALWAQDTGLARAGNAVSGYDWSRREEAAAAFKARASPVASGLARHSLKHGVSYRFSFNESVASAYVDSMMAGEAESIGGVIVVRDGGSVKVSGCGYDVTYGDRTTTYAVNRVKAWS